MAEYIARVPNVQLNDIQAILNMRDAWRHLLGTLDEPITLEYLCKLNELIARNEALEWGELRTGRVACSETEYIPPVPSLETVTYELEGFLTSDTTATEKTLTAFTWGQEGSSSGMGISAPA